MASTKTQRKKSAKKNGAKRNGAKKSAATRSVAKKRNAKKNGATKARRSEKQRKAIGKLAKMMRGIDLCMMTTQGDRGSLHTRPMSNNGEVDFDGDAWFFSARKSAKVQELQRDPRVALSYVGGKKRKPVWIAVSGTGEIVDDVAKKTKLWVRELEQWFGGGPEDPNVVLIHVKAATASWWKYDAQETVDLG